LTRSKVLQEVDTAGRVVEAAGDDEKISALQEQYKVMTSLQKKISTGLGGRLII